MALVMDGDPRGVNLDVFNSEKSFLLTVFYPSIFIFLAQFWNLTEKNSFNANYFGEGAANKTTSRIQASIFFFNFNTFCGNASLRCEEDKIRSD